MKTDLKTIKNPRITEKASFAVEKGVYTFDLKAGANKSEIVKEIFTKFKVKPVKVNILSVKDKTKTVRGRKTVVRGGKKALVYLKKGDKIDLS